MKMALQSRFRIGVLPVSRRAKDGQRTSILDSVGSRGLAGMGPVADAGPAQPHTMAVADRAAGAALRAGATHGDLVAASTGHRRRLRRLLLLPLQLGTQDRTAGHAPVARSVGLLAAGRASAAGERRFAHSALWTERRSGLPAPQSHLRS